MCWQDMEENNTVMVIMEGFAKDILFYSRIIKWDSRTFKIDCNPFENHLFCININRPVNRNRYLIKCRDNIKTGDLFNMVSINFIYSLNMKSKSCTTLTPTSTCNRIHPGWVELAPLRSFMEILNSQVVPNPHV